MNTRSPLLKFLVPAVSAVLLIALCVHGLGPQIPPADEKYLARVAAAMDAIPYRIGDLVGTDMEPTAAAVKLLRPNRILQRHYMNPGTRESITLLFVHCADVHDMLGHYPPVCYPAHGWVASQAAAVPLAINGRTAETSFYSFTRSDDNINKQLDVQSFFILPGSDPAIVRDMDTLVKAARSPGAAGLGAAQVQLLTDGVHAPADRAALTAQVLAALEPSIRAISGGPAHE